MDTKEKVEQWRMKADAGTLTLPEMREAITFLRENRQSATVKAKKKGKSKKVINSDELLSEIGGL